MEDKIGELFKENNKLTQYVENLKHNLEETVASLDELKQQLEIETTTKQLQDIKTVEGHVSGNRQSIDENGKKLELIGQKNIQEQKNPGIISR